MQNTDKHLIRCHWCTDDEIYIEYHDNEWGVPSFDDRHLFEMLILEGFQAGLSWLTILRKRAAFKQAFYNFDAKQLAQADDNWLATNMQNPAIIRNKLKLQSSIINANAWLKIKDPVDFIWSTVRGKSIINNYASAADIPTVSSYAENLSKQLKKHGFKFVGPTICQSYLQAIGCLMDHTTDCYRHAELANKIG